jgi:hypothetical protein
VTIVVKPSSGAPVHTFALPVVREIPPSPATAGGVAW